jgi:hypothetical protein
MVGNAAFNAPATPKSKRISFSRAATIGTLTCA